MKARLLRKLLNDTGYTPNNSRDYIALGSPMCHDLISVNKKTLKIKYALDTFNEGRKCVEGRSNKELLFIWDKLHELVESGEIKDIIEGIDELENPLPVYSVEDGKLIESFTDEYGYPNFTHDGYIMYENTHFETKKEAIEQGIVEEEVGISMDKRRLPEEEERVERIKNRIIDSEKNIIKLKKINY